MQPSPRGSWSTADLERPNLPHLRLRHDGNDRRSRPFYHAKQRYGMVPQNVLVAFFGGMVITTLVELVGRVTILYKIFHTRWWDYSMYRFNLGGFICPQFSLLWGLGSVLLMVVVHPLLSKPSAAIPPLC